MYYIVFAQNLFYNVSNWLTYPINNNYLKSQAIITSINKLNNKLVTIIRSRRIFNNWLTKLLTTKYRPIVIPPPKTGKERSNKIDVINTDQTYKGIL